MRRSYGCFLLLSSLLLCGMLLLSSAGMVPAVQRSGLDSGPADTSWPIFRHDTLHSARSSYAGTRGAGVKWTLATGGLVMSSPAIAADGTIYIGSMDGYLYAVSSLGVVKWTFATTTTGVNRGINASPAVGSDGTIYVGALDGNMYAVEPDSGVEKWRYPTGGAIMSSCVIGSDEAIYFGSDDNYVYALTSTGVSKWASPFSTSGRVTSSPAIDSSGTVYVGSWDGSLYALSSTDGTMKWSFATGDMIISSPSLSADEQWVFFGSYDGSFYGVDAATGETTYWYHTITTSTPQFVSSPAIGFDGTIYAGCVDGHLYAFYPTTGNLVWAYYVGYPIISSPAVGADGVIYFAAQDGTVYALEVSGTTPTLLWAQATAGSSGALGDGVQSSPAIGQDGTIYVGAADKNLYAIKQQFTLTTAVSPTGSGSVTLTPSGGTYDAGTTVSVRAVANSGYVFDSWTGDLTGSANPSSIVMSANKSVTAVFKKQQFTLTTAVSPAGSGSVTLTPSGGTYDAGTTVSVRAVANSGYVFDSWTGDLTGSANPSSIVMSANKSVTAVFKKQQFTLTTAVSPTGSGSVTLTPSGGTYDAGTTVSVTAVAGTGYVFKRWKGDLAGSVNPSSIVMSANKSVTAVFQKVSVQYTLTTAVSPTESGAVTLTPSGGIYESGRKVVLKAVAGSGYVFDRWTGDLTGSANPSSIVMSANKSVTAVFSTLDSVVIAVPSASKKATANGYRMIGIPLLSSTAGVRDVFSTIAPFFGGAADPYTWALYKSNGTTLIAKTGVDSVQYGKGWWIVSTKARKMKISGKPLTTDFSMSVSPVSNGKQMVACPFSDRTILWANVVADSANASLLLGARLYYYQNGEYVVVKTMKPGKAYWVTIGNESGGTLLIRRDYDGVAASSKALLASATEKQELPPPLGPGSHITVGYPTGGTHLKDGKRCNIRWSSSGISPEGFTSRVNISVSMDGGENYTLIAEGVPNTGVYRWAVPEGAAGVHCRVKIASDLYPRVSGVTGEDFSIIGK